MPPISTEKADCVKCPECDFRFSAEHADDDGNFFCPVCELTNVNHKRLGYFYVLWCLAMNNGGQTIIKTRDDYTGEIETIDVDQTEHGLVVRAGVSNGREASVN